MGGKRRGLEIWGGGHINGSALLSFHTYEAATGKLLEKLINPKFPTKTHQTQPGFFFSGSLSTKHLVNISTEKQILKK